MQQVQTAMEALQTTRLGAQRVAMEHLSARLHVLEQLDRAPLLYARLVSESARRFEFLRLHRTVRCAALVSSRLVSSRLVSSRLVSSPLLVARSS